MDHALTKEDLQVKVGEADCVITSVSLNQLTCEPPRLEEAGNNPKVMVSVSKHANTDTLSEGGIQTQFSVKWTLYS